LPLLALNLDPSDLCLLNSEDYRLEPPALASSDFTSTFKSLLTFLRVAIFVCWRITWRQSGTTSNNNNLSSSFFFFEILGCHL
jgi:hypothetical protein